MALPDPTRVHLLLPHLTFHHYELILHVFLVDLGFDFAGVQLVYVNAFFSPVLSSIFLEINVAILHDV